jgi:hypothetical protein
MTRSLSPRPTTSPAIQDEREPTRRKGDQDYQGCGAISANEPGLPRYTNPWKSLEVVKLA